MCLVMRELIVLITLLTLRCLTFFQLGLQGVVFGATQQNEWSQNPFLYKTSRCFLKVCFMFSSTRNRSQPSRCFLSCFLSQHARHAHILLGTCIVRVYFDQDFFRDCTGFRRTCMYARRECVQKKSPF